MSTNPNRWWQWVLLYPTLVISIIASVPTYIEAFQSYKIGVEFGESKSAKKQADMWRENLQCTSAPYEPLITPNNIEVDATICETGDVLVKVITPKKDKFYRWVSINSIMEETAFNFNIINTAYADTYKENEVILLAIVFHLINYT